MKGLHFDQKWKEKNWGLLISNTQKTGQADKKFRQFAD